MNKYFLDTYALIEIIKGNPNYAKYSDKIAVMTRYNLIEFYYSCISEYSSEVARLLYLKFKECIISIEDDVIFEAMAMKKKLKKTNLSYVDCIGYICAKKMNILFLTGDKEFKNLPGVEFVK